MIPEVAAPAVTTRAARRPGPGQILRSFGTWAARCELVLPVVFLIASGKWFASFVAGPGSLGYDGRLYAFAARAMLEGHDPWRATFYGADAFAGPPTSLIPFLPFAYLPEQLVAAAWIALNAVLAIVILRRLALPAWWLAFPPLFIPIVMGGVELLMVALLVWGSGLALLLKPYALLPLLAERRWRAIAIGTAVGVVSLVVLPWGTFLADAPLISRRLADQQQVLGANAFGNPVLMAVSVIALLSFGLRRALWLATPVLWPSGQLHYAAMTVPVLPAIVALLWAVPIPGVLVAGIVVGAVANRIWPQRIVFARIE